MYAHVCAVLISAESQKGINADQECSVEIQKGATAVQSLWS